MIDSKVTLARHAGFCNGVKSAVSLAEEASAAAQAVGVSIVTKGALVHNKNVVESLNRKGVEIIYDIEDARDKIVIIPSHGLKPEEISKLKKVAKGIVDATCPYVTKVQKTAHDYSKQGYNVIIVGDRNHPEVLAVKACGGEKAHIITSPLEVDMLHLDDEPVVLISQTTQMKETFDAIFEKMKKVYGERIEKINTICPATALRQEAAAALAETVELMIIVGGKNSANTRRLAEICEIKQAMVIQVEGADEIDPVSLNGIRKVGISAGASTPRHTIEEVVTTVTDILNNNNESSEAFDITMEEALATLPKRPKTDESEIVEAVVTAIFDDRILVDIGTGSDATVMADQLSIRQSCRPSDLVKKGDKINVVIGSYDKKSDSRMASKVKADALVIWDSLSEALENNKTVKGYVSEIVRGGLVVDIGTRAFVPASQIDIRFVEDLTPYLKNEYDFKIIEVNKEKGSVILSRKTILEGLKNAAKEKVFSTLNVGDIVEGKVSRLADFGAFIDIGDGVEGLLHVSEISWSRISHPSKVLKEGSAIKVKILNIEPEKERISLGYKQMQQDPWETVEIKYPVDSIVSGTVVRTADFGAFVKLEDGVEGLVHISQLDDKRVTKTSDVVSPGQEVSIKVVSIDIPNRKISLSMKQAKEAAQKEFEGNKEEELTKYQSEDMMTSIADALNVDVEKIVEETIEESEIAE